MNIHFTHQITHTSIIISDKVNFFADVFDFTLLNYGQQGFQELENHKSLLEKIKFQLDNFTQHSKQYINHYFGNNYLEKQDWLIKEFYSSEWQSICIYKKEFQADFSNSSKRSLLNQEITSLIHKLDETLFENAKNKIIDAIMCKHPLEKHNHIQIFQYYTPIIVSEFIFAGFPKNDLQELFDKILTKEVKFKNSKVHTDAPLPQSLLEIKNNSDNSPELFYNAVNDYLKNRTLKQQFEGIYYLFKNSLKSKTYLFPLVNVNAFKPITLTYNGVMFSNEFRKNYVKRGSTQKAYRDFFNGKGKLFAEVSINENNDEVGKSNAILKINNALNFLNSTLDKKARIEIDDYIIRDNDNNLRYKNSLKVIHPKDKKKFLRNNAYEMLSSNTDNLTAKFLLLDTIYFQAENDERIESKVVNYWRYIESFFEAEDYNSKSVMEIVSRIVSKK